MRKIAARTYMMAAVTASVLGLASFSAASLVSQREVSLSAARSALLLDATLLARNLEGVFRAAEAHLLAAAESLGSGPPAARARGILAELGSRIPETENVYLLDAGGGVAALAYPRRDPSLRLTTSSLEALRQGGNAFMVGAEAPAEGGPVMALIVPLRADLAASPPNSAAIAAKVDFFLAALFSDSLVEERISLLREREFFEIVIMDQADRVLFRKAYDSLSGEPERASYPSRAEAAFRTKPLRILIRHDIGHVLSRWREQVGLTLVATSVFLLLIASLSWLGARSARRARMAEDLRRELEAKDLLFREVNHRVKNNLAIVASMLSLGEGEARERPEAAAELLRDSVDRVRSMSLLHEQLYRRSSLASTDFGLYLDDLGGALRESYDVAGRIELLLEVEPNLSLPLAVSVPLSLIVNELVTNAYKHAFPAGSQGRITVSASRRSVGDLLLGIADDGVGEEARTEEKGFGMTLVRSLAAQVKATIVRREGAAVGVAWDIRVPASVIERASSKANPSY